MTATMVENSYRWGQQSSADSAKNRMTDILEHERQYAQRGEAEPAGHRLDLEDMVLDGKGSNECSCRVSALTALGEPVFDCCETRPGECMYRVGSEPDLKCLYCLERYEGDHVRKACIREEANEYARLRMYEDRVEAMSSESVMDPVIASRY